MGRAKNSNELKQLKSMKMPPTLCGRRRRRPSTTARHALRMQRDAAWSRGARRPRTAASASSGSRCTRSSACPCGRPSIPYLMTALRAGSGGQRYRDRCRRRRPPRSRCRCSVEQFLRSKRLEVGRPKVLVSRPRPRTGSGPCFAARSRRPAQPKLNRWNYRKFR